MKKTLVMAALLTFAAEIFAYNPPRGGEDLYRLDNPELLSGAASAVGGPAMTIVSGSVAYNPALIAGEQRIGLDIGATMFLNYNAYDGDDDLGFGMSGGLILPTKWAVFAGNVTATFADFYGMNLRNTIIFNGAAAKDINDKLSVGSNVYFGLYMGEGADFSVGVDLGALYKLDDFACFKNPRVGFSLLNLGKPAPDYAEYGVKAGEPSGYPSILTPRAGFGATLFEFKKVSGAFSVDLSSPMCQNFVSDLAFTLDFNDFIRLNFSSQLNFVEMVERKGDGINLVSVGASIKLGMNSKKLTEKNAEWEQSEIIPAIATQPLYTGIEAISVGAKLNLGAKDTTAPEIILWNVEE